MEMKTYHCMDPKENPQPVWTHARRDAIKEQQEDAVARFKADPDSFFPDPTQDKKP
jgi:hypothetical protein